jgi:glutamine cyclotransferase
MRSPWSGTYKVIAKYPHSTDSYTEGFFYLNGLFYEGTGLKATPQSSSPTRNRQTSSSVRSAPQYFGEGIIDWGPNLYEWTWQSHIGFVYDRFTLRKSASSHYDGEGWGMTRTAKGTHHQRRHRTSASATPTPSTKRAHRRQRRQAPIDQLNELEYIKGEIYANVWHSDRIARISPQDGHVIAWIDLTGLLPDDQKVNAESVLNGIAYDAQSTTASSSPASNGPPSSRSRSWHGAIDWSGI